MCVATPAQLRTINRGASPGSPTVKQQSNGRGGHILYCIFDGSIQQYTTGISWARCSTGGSGRGDCLQRGKMRGNIIIGEGLTVIKPAVHTRGHPKLASLLHSKAKMCTVRYAPKKYVLGWNTRLGARDQCKHHQRGDRRE